MLTCPDPAPPPAAAHTDQTLVTAMRYASAESLKDQECRDKLKANAAFHAARKLAFAGEGR